MAKSISPDEAILTGLRKAINALPKLLPLCDKKGLFSQEKAKAEELASTAIAKGFLTQKEESRKVKKAATTVVCGVITEVGMRHVLDADGPKGVLESLLPAVQLLSKQPDAPNPEVMRAELVKATETCVKAIKESFAKLEAAMLKAVAPQAEPAISPSIVLNALHQALERVQVPIPPVHAPAPQPPAPAPTARQEPRHVEPPPVAKQTVDLESSMRQAYEKLRLLLQFRNGLIEIPRLYAEVTKVIPSLAVKAFQEKLVDLWEAEKVELHILNEVRRAEEPEKGIHRDGNLYYYVMWK